MVEVKVIRSNERVSDPLYLMIVYGDHAMIVDAAKGSTKIVPLPLSDRTLSGAESHAAAIECALKVAEIWKIPVVYTVEYPQWRSGDPLPLPP